MSLLLVLDKNQALTLSRRAGSTSQGDVLFHAFLRPAPQFSGIDLTEVSHPFLALAPILAIFWRPAPNTFGLAPVAEQFTIDNVQDPAAKRRLRKDPGFGQRGAPLASA